MALKSRFMQGCEPYFKIGTNGIGIIFQHGATGTPASMIHAAEYFHKKAYTVLAPRLAGHATVAADLKRCTVDDFRTELETAVALMHSCCDKLILCGLSMGSVTASIVGSYSDIDGLVLMAGPSPKYSVGEDGLKKETGSRNVEKSGWHKPELKGDWKLYTDIDMESLNTIIRDLISVSETAIPNISVPTQLIYSKGDSVVAAENGQVIYNMLRCDRKYISVLEHSGHVLVADGERDTVFHIIEKFIVSHCLR
jgi:carboxylesterase